MSQFKNNPAVSVGGQGLLFALAGYALLPFGDAMVKSATTLWPATAIAALRFFFGAVGLGVILLMQEGRGGFSIPHAKTHWIRAFALAFGSVSFFIGVTQMPLGDATAIGFVMPMITAILSAIFLGEKVGRAVWLASLIAFIGVLIILRPNVADFGFAALFPLGAALGMAVLILLNRKVAGSASVLAMQFITAVFATPILIGFALIGHVSGLPAFVIDWPEASVVLRCALVAMSASLAHALIFIATTRASAATVAPMTYAQLLVALVLSAVFFGDWPDLTSLGGSALIIIAGLYLWRNARPSLP
jgi:drug/metabolite transporter (DMT)-like permease